MSSRFQSRDAARNSLFSAYDAPLRTNSTSPGLYPSSGPRVSGAGPGSGAGRGGNAYPYSSQNTTSHNANSFSAYPGANDARQGVKTFKSGGSAGGTRYNEAVLDELESQNDSQVSEMGKRVAMLKDITLKIGDEIRDSTALAEKMNDSFGNTGLKLKKTMNRMLQMAERTGVGWKVWLGFFAFVIFIFWYVWLFR